MFDFKKRYSYRRSFFGSLVKPKRKGILKQIKLLIVANKLARFWKLLKIFNHLLISYTKYKQNYCSFSVSCKS